MADYYPLIARAVAGLDKNTGDARRALYERARSALVAQLRGVTPALDESDVTRERLALEEAIRKVEGESARQTTVRPNANRIKVPQFPRWQEPEPEPERQAETAPELEPGPEPESEPESAPRTPARRLQPPGQPERPQQERFQGGRQEDERQQDGRRQDGRQQEARQQDGRQDGRPAAPTARPRGDRFAEGAHEAAQGDRGDRAESRRPGAPFRQGRDERQGHQQERQERPDRQDRAEGRQFPLSSRGRTEARRGYEDDDYEEGEEPVLESEPAEPRNSARSRRDRGERRSLINSNFREFRETVSEADELGGASARAKRAAKEKFAAVPNSKPSRARDPESDEAYLTLDDIAEQPVMLEPSFVVDESRPVPPRGRPAKERTELERSIVPRRSYADLVRIVAAVAVVGLLVSLLIWQWPNLQAIYSNLTTPSAPSGQTSDNPPASQRKMTDRIEPGGRPSQPQGYANVAQRVVLYEEDPGDPNGKSAAGSVTWATETVSPGSGKPPELQVRGNIEIPERGMSITWVLHRNTEPNSSSSHTIEINFKVPANFAGGGIFSVPGIWMKEAEQTPQGTALDGISVKVTTNYFLIGLNGIASVRDRNVSLLKDRPWIEIPIVYTNNRRAILAIEKGPPGERAFGDAFAAWGQ